MTLFHGLWELSSQQFGRGCIVETLFESGLGEHQFFCAFPTKNFHTVIKDLPFYIKFWARVIHLKCENSAVDCNKHENDMRSLILTLWVHCQSASDYRRLYWNHTGEEKKIMYNKVISKINKMSRGRLNDIEQSLL